MKIKKVPNYTKILHTCEQCGCEFYVKKNDYICKTYPAKEGEKETLHTSCPYCRTAVQVITNFDGVRQTICEDLQMYIKQLIKKIPGIKDEFTRNELEGFATLVYGRIEEEKLK